MRTSYRYGYGLCVILFLVFTLGPLMLCLLMSITPGNEITKITTSFWPSYLTLEAYREIWRTSTAAHQVVFTGIKNSLITLGWTVLIGLPIAVGTAYTFVRYQFKFKTWLLRGFLITIVIPVFSTIIPIFALFSEHHLLDSLFWMSVIYVSAFIPFATWLLINHFRNLPRELWEAAVLDGCNEWQVFCRVVLPVSRTAVMTTALILGLMSWSQFQIPMILTASQTKKVATLVLSEFMTRDAIDYSLIAAAGILIVLPPMLIALIFRKALVRGLTQGAVKS